MSQSTAMTMASSSLAVLMPITIEQAPRKEKDIILIFPGIRLVFCGLKAQVFVHMSAVMQGYELKVHFQQDVTNIQKKYWFYLYF